jgi:DNA polymerase-3 subunit delta
MPASAAERLFDQLGKGKAPAALVLLGSDSYWLRLCRRRLMETLVPEAAREWAVTRISAEEAAAVEVIGRAQMRPMLAPRQLVFVAETEAWERGNEATLKENVEALGDYFDDPAPFTVLVFEAEKFDQRTRLARLLNERALVVDLGAPGSDLAQLAIQMARDLGMEMEREAALALAESTGGSAARMATEVEKLSCYAAQSGRITKADVRELVVAEGPAEVWELSRLLALGERGRALELAGDLMAKGDSAPQLVGALAWMFRKLVEASELSPSTNEWQAAKRLGMRPESAATAIQHARRIPKTQLREALEALAEADDRLKSTGADDRGIMEFLLARLSRLGAERDERAGSKRR